MEHIKLTYKWNQIKGVDLWGIGFPVGYNSRSKNFVMFYVGFLVKSLDGKIIEPNSIFKGSVIKEINPSTDVRQIAKQIADVINEPGNIVFLLSL